MLWIVGLTFTVSILTQAGDYSLLSELFPPIRDVTTISLLTWSLLRMVRRMESNMLAKAHDGGLDPTATDARSEEHTSELPSLMRTSYAVFCLTKKTD